MSQPITDKESSDGEDGRFKYGTTAMQGWRTNMEVRERGGFGRRLCRSRPASRRRPRVANGEISVTFRADTRLARGRFRAAAARSPDPSLSRRRSPNPSPAFDRRTLTPRFSAWTKIPPSSACTTATAARRCVHRPRLLRSHPTWPKGASFFPHASRRSRICSRPVARASRIAALTEAVSFSSRGFRARARARARRRLIARWRAPRRGDPNRLARARRWPSTSLGTCTRCSRIPRRTSAGT